MKIFHRIAATDASSRGNGKKFTRGNGNGGSTNHRIESNDTPSAGILSGWGLLVYYFPAERIKGDIYPLEQVFMYDPHARMMRSKFNLVSRAGLEVSIESQDAIVLLFLEFAV